MARKPPPKPCPHGMPPDDPCAACAFEKQEKLAAQPHLQLVPPAPESGEHVGPVAVLPPARPDGFTPADDDEQVGFLAQLVTRGATRAHMEQLAKQKYGIGRARVDALLVMLRARLTGDFESARPHAKGLQAARLEGYLAALIKDGKWTTVTRIESLLADIYGTRDPVQVSVAATVSSAAVKVIASLTEEQMAEMLARARERKALAEIGQQKILSLPDKPSPSSSVKH